MLNQYESLTVRQQVESLQVFTGLETANRYCIQDPGGAPLAFAYEESGFMARQFLNSHRPLTINLLDDAGNTLLIARRSFFWFLSHLEFRTPQDEFLGRLERRFAVFGRRFTLSDARGEVGNVAGSLFRPNTFVLRRDGQELARITKRWSGLVREAFTAADRFQVEFLSPTLTEGTRWLVLGTALAIDLEFFEKRSNGPGSSNSW